MCLVISIYNGAYSVLRNKRETSNTLKEIDIEMVLTNKEVIEIIEEFRTWAYIEDMFGSVPNKAVGERVEEHLLNLLYEAEYFEAHDTLFDYLDIMDEFSYSGFLDALDFTLDTLQE